MSVTELGIPALFLAGLAASPHCSLMCGPLQLAQLRRSGGRARAAAWLHLGRVSGYAVLGAMGGAVGAQGLMQLPSPTVGAGVQLAAALVLAWLGFGYLRAPQTACCAPPLRTGAGRVTALTYLARGWAWALLPCAALYAMLLLAVLSASAAYGAALMAAFGLGTVPLVAGTALALQRHLGSTRGARRTAALVLLAVATIAAVSAGLGDAGLWCRPPSG